MKKIFLPLRDYKSIGGPTTFMKNFAKFCEDRGVDYTSHFSLWRVSSILFPIKYNFFKLLLFKMAGVRIVQRLDGLISLPWSKNREFRWRGLKHFVKASVEMFQVGIIYRFLADKVIFQSQFCEKMVSNEFGLKDESRVHIIYNGVHKDVFYPSYERKSLSSNPIVFVTTGRFRTRIMLSPLIEALDGINDESFELKIIGPVTFEGGDELLKRNYVKYFESAQTNEIAKVLRESDIYLFSQVNPPCPNSVLEAIASGLPVVSYNVGSLPELLHFNLDLLADAGLSEERIFASSEDLDVNDFREKIRLCIQDYAMFKGVALQHSQDYDFDTCGQRYLEVLR